MSYSLQSDFGFSSSIKKLNTLILDVDQDPEKIALVFESLQEFNNSFPKSEVSLVWSGPNLLGVHMRMTLQVVLEMIDQASENLFISSFSFYKIGAFIVALERAIARGVDVSLLLETPQSSHYKITHNPMGDFSDEFKTKASFYIWPYKNRKIEGDDQTGSLHAKFILQDNQRLFITSANLTQYAMDRNIELGVIIEDQDVVEKFFHNLEMLVAKNIITRI